MDGLETMGHRVPREIVERPDEISSQRATSSDLTGGQADEDRKGSQDQPAPQETPEHLELMEPTADLGDRADQEPRANLD